MNTMEIYKKIERLRKNKHMSVFQLSKEADISHSTLYSWRARKTMPTIEVLEKICNALNIPMSKLLFDLESAELSEEQKVVMELWGALNREQKDAFLNMLKSIAAK